jgi:hypothetical protein
MKRIAITTVLFLAIAAIAAAQSAKQKQTPPIGNEETAGPLQLSILIDHSEKIPAVLVTVKNVGDDDYILPIGSTTFGPFARTHLSFEILLTTVGGQPATVLYRRVAGVAGRVDPAFTTLVRHSTYTMRLPTDDYVGGETNQLLNELADSDATLQVRYRPNEHNCPRMIDGRNPTMLRCWTNALISNAVTY